MRVLVCGDRNWDDSHVIDEILQGIYDLHSIGYLVTHVQHMTVIEGGAKGADRAAADWANTTGPHPGDTSLVDPDHCAVIHEQYPADWDRYRKAAGPIRNKQMLYEGKPDAVWAFHDHLANSKGTKDMVTRAKKAGIPVYVVSRA
jgi:hypothetical protein